MPFYCVARSFLSRGRPLGSCFLTFVVYSFSFWYPHLVMPGHKRPAAKPPASILRRGRFAGIRLSPACGTPALRRRRSRPHRAAPPPYGGQHFGQIQSGICFAYALVQNCFGFAPRNGESSSQVDRWWAFVGYHSPSHFQLRRCLGHSFWPTWIFHCADTPRGVHAGSFHWLSYLCTKRSWFCRTLWPSAPTTGCSYFASHIR